MSILQLQRRIAEVGRIRIGQQVATSSGKKRPAKLDTFRLTSPNRTRVDQAARLYGGNVVEWEAPAGNQWEVVTQTDSLAVIVPPSDMAFSQHYELWSGGGCQRRCDGLNESISDGSCICDPDKRQCNIHTRLSVMLRDLPGLGIWRIDTSGYYAATELQGAVDVMQMAAKAGAMLPAQLRLEQRMVKRDGKTMRFAVPVLDVEISPAQLVGGGPIAMVDGTPGTLAIEAPADVVDGGAPLTPVPQSVPERPTAPIAEQATATKERKPRKNAAQPVPRSKIKPRTAAQAAAQDSSAGLTAGKSGERTAGNDMPPPAEPPPAEPPPDQPAGNDPPASTAQNRKMHALFRDVDLGDRDDRLTVCSAILGFPLTTSTGLTIAEASKLIDTLEQWITDGRAGDEIREILNAATLAAEQKKEK